MSHDNTEAEYIRREQENILHREIALLSENYRKATVLYYFEDESCGEIAGILGKSIGTVKWWLHHEYEATVPKHLHWQMGNFLSNNLGNFVTCSLYEGVKNVILSAQDDNNKDWLSLFASE